MQILARDIADNKENYTRFFVLSQQDSAPTGKDKTRIIFSAKHEPGSLYNALGEFAKRNINLTRIESRPTKKTAWEYNFYLDFEGHWTESAPKHLKRWRNTLFLSKSWALTLKLLLLFELLLFLFLRGKVEVAFFLSKARLLCKRFNSFKDVSWFYWGAAIPADKNFSVFWDINHGAAFGAFTSRHY